MKPRKASLKLNVAKLRTLTPKHLDQARGGDGGVGGVCRQISQNKGAVGPPCNGKAGSGLS
jgi:hypothetical protein